VFVPLSPLITAGFFRLLAVSAIVKLRQNQSREAIVSKTVTVRL